MKKIISFCLAAALVLAMVPLIAAPEAEAADISYVTLKKIDSVIAPGVNQTIKYVRKANQAQLVYYTMDIDLTQEVKIFANYKNNEWVDGEPGLQNTSAQFAAAQRKFDQQGNNYKVVGGVNADFYDMSNGRPSGAFVMGGEIINTANGRSFFAIRQNGEAVIGYDNNDWNKYNTSENPIVEAVGGGAALVKNGAIQSTATGDPNARTAVGIKSNHEVVLLMTDGKQVPFSEGADMGDLAKILYDMGCTDAINLDGGGSSTYLSRPEGTTNVKVVNKPCDGYERAVSDSLMVVSTVQPSNVFQRALIEADAEYITPGGTVNLTATGISPAGTPIDIPSDISWAVEGEGTVTDTGKTAVFTASENTGEVKVEMKRNGESVGSVTIHVVQPTEFAFSRSTYAVPFGESLDLKVTAKYKPDASSEYDVTLHNDFTTEITSDESGKTIGTIDGLKFTAAAMSDETATTGRVKATLNGGSGLTAEAVIKLGRGSEVIESFEDGPSYLSKLSTNTETDADNYTIAIEIVDSSNGKVKTGQYALKITVDWRQITTLSDGEWQIYVKTSDQKFLNQELTGALQYGMWVWTPEEDEWGAYMVCYDLDGVNKLSYKDNNNKEGRNYDDGYWYYATADLSAATGKIKPSTTLLSVLLWTLTENDDLIMSTNGKNVYYVDDISVDYSLVMPDRDAPVISEVVAPQMESASSNLVMRGDIFEFDSGIDSPVFEASVEEVINDSTTGINPDSVKAYIDGVEVGVSFIGEGNSGKIRTEGKKLAPGVHTLKLYISDEKENESSVTRQFRITSGENVPTVEVVGSDKNEFKDKIPASSLYFVDVKATDVSEIQSVSMDLDLNNVSTWELDHAYVNPKFELKHEFKSYYEEDENIATVTITRKEGCEWEEGDDTLLASLPIRAWGTGYPDPQKAWAADAFLPEDISVEIDRGEITFTPGHDNKGVANTFSGKTVQVDTELYTVALNLKKDPEYSGRTSWHVHDTVLVSQQKDATCTENGYSGRTYCDGCKSVVEWGEDIPALGHQYELNDETGLLECTRCHDKFTGEWDDGKTYKDGEPVGGETGEWVGNSYYVGGEKVTGVYAIEETQLDESGAPQKDEEGKEIKVNRYYDFGTDGVCKNLSEDKSTPLGITGFFKKEPGSNDTYYAENGLLRPGWLFLPPDYIDPDWDENEQKEHLDVYHIGDDGIVHTDSDGHYEDGAAVDTDDQRKCTENNFIFYKCKQCAAQTQSELLWFKGHTWQDEENGIYHCTVCGKDGIDIANTELRTDGYYFTYTGQDIRASHALTYNGRLLSIASDRRGHDGLSTFNDNKEIGVATITVSGRGDFYGEKIGHFEIVPENVTGLTVTEGANHTLTLNWNTAYGADSYCIQTLDADGNWQWTVQKVEGTTYTFSNIEVGSDYGFRVGSRADAPDKTQGGTVRTFYCTQWSNEVTGTLEHDWNTASDSKDPTCTENGYVVHTCQTEGCQYHDEALREEIPALGHNVTEWTVETPATTTAPGVESGNCERCGEKQTREIPQLPPVYVGTGNTTSPDAEQETVTNPDGSKTTTTTTKDGTVTETTEQTDGTVTEKITEKDGTSVETTTTPEGVVGTTGKDASGNVTNAEVTVPQGGSEGVVKAPVEVPSAGSTKDAPQINVHVQGEKSVKMEVPVTDFGPGTVAVVVHPDGTEEVVRDCVVGEDGVILNVEGDVTLKIVENSAEFKDIERVESWAGDAIEFTSARELFSGTGNNNFQPDGKMSRGALVTLLYRLSYEPDAPALKFGDVDESSIYADAVAWADSNSIVSGYGNGTFMPDNVITREQLVTLIYQYAQFKGVVKPNTGNINSFTDADKVSNYAKEAMAWAIGAGIVSGQGDNTLNPTGSTTRAQTAVILMKLCDYMAK